MKQNLLSIRLPLLLFLTFIFLNIQEESKSQTRLEQFGIFDIPVDMRTWSALDALGVGWVREQFRLGEADIEFAMPFYSKIFQEGYGLLLTVYHRDSTNITNIESYRQSERGGYPPADSSVYKEKLIHLVETLAIELIRQGKDPGDNLVIQFCNEVLPIDIAGDNLTRFWHGTSDEYLTSLNYTYNAVKSIGTFDIPVANAGISSLAMELMLDYEENPAEAEPGIEKIYSFNERILLEGEFDWADIHLRHAVEDIDDKINWVKQRWSGKLAATEFAGPDVRTGITYTEQLQAEELVERMTIAIENGVDRIFWSHLVESTAVEPIYFHEGLIEHETWRRKPAYYAYVDFIHSYITSVEDELPNPGFELYQNYPNPFNPTTTINFTVPILSPVYRQAGYEGEIYRVRLVINDILGRELAVLVDQRLTPGIHAIEFDASFLSSGVYFYRIEIGEFSKTKKLMLIK